MPSLAEPMKTTVFILIPYSVGPAGVTRFADEVLGRYCAHADHPVTSGRYDYLVGVGDKGLLNDPTTERRLPLAIRRMVTGRICEVEHLPSEAVPGAVITPDGAWHDLSDFGWRLIDGRSTSNLEAEARWAARYRELLARHPHCWVLETRAHS